MDKRKVSGFSLPDCSVYLKSGRQLKIFLLGFLISFFQFGIASAQSTTVSGTVLGVSNEPLSGVSITVKETKNSTVSAKDGSFSIMVSKGNTVSFSYVGYETRDIVIGSETTLSVLLTIMPESLDQIVVVSYGNQRKRNITGAVSTISAKKLEDLPVGQLTQKMQGQFTGVQINQSSGSLGGGMDVRIRGAASINAGYEPLYVVDGFPIVGNISQINPDEIETISILKDASASALYGSRAANGVVLITTKKAKEGQSEIQFNSNFGFQNLPSKNRPDKRMMNGAEWAQFRKEIYEDAALYEGYTGGVPVEFQNPSQYGEGTNWYMMAFNKNAPITNYNLTFTSGKEKFSTSTTLGYLKQKGIVLNTDLERYSLRSNNEYRFNDKIKVGVNLASSYQSSQNFQDGSFNYFYNLLVTPPTVSPYNPDGTYKEFISAPGTFTQPNPIRSISIRKNRYNVTQLLGNVYAQVNFTKELYFKTLVGTNLQYGFQNEYVPKNAGFAFFSGALSYGNYNTNNFYSWLNENTLNYAKNWGDHSVELLAGYTSQRYQQENSFLSGTDFPDDAVQWIDASATRNGGANNTAWSLLSGIGRVNYNYNGKYLVSAAIRRDGSSRFGAKKKYGTFPSVSVGWILSDEKFMQSIKAISFLKFRASYGVTGNNNIGNYTQFGNVNSTNYVFNGTISPGRSLTNIGNEELTWETTKQFNIGFDFGVLKNRLSFSFDYYKKTTDDLLYQIDIPLASGYSSIQSNIGTIDFWGYEVGVSSKNLVGELKWNTDFNISFNRNKVIKLGTNNTPIGGYGQYVDNSRTSVGHPIGMFWGYEVLGLYKDQQDLDKSPKNTVSAIGTVKYRDVNGDGVITQDDRTFIGNPNPKFVFGMTNNFSYKNFDLNIIISGAYGGDIMDNVPAWTEDLSGVFNVEKYVKDRWRSPSNPGAGQIQRSLSGTTAYPREPNSRFVFDGSYLTIKNIALGYNLPVKIKYVKRVRAYLSIQQALVITNYRGTNPEVSDSGLNALTMGVDGAGYPVPRTVSAGFNITF